MWDFWCKRLKEWNTCHHWRQGFSLRLYLKRALVGTRRDDERGREEYEQKNFSKENFCWGVTHIAGGEECVAADQRGRTRQVPEREEAGLSGYYGDPNFKSYGNTKKRKMCREIPNYIWDMRMTAPSRDLFLHCKLVCKKSPRQSWQHRMQLTRRGGRL